MKSRVGFVLAGLLALAVPTASLAAVTLTVGNASGKPGDQVEFTVSLNITDGDNVASYSVESLVFAPETRIPNKGTSMTSADCALAPGVEATLNQYRFCTPNSGTQLCDACTGTTCPAVKVAILGPEGGYSESGPSFLCKVNISAEAAPGDYPLASAGAAYAKANGDKVAIPDASGIISVVVDTPTPPVPTATNTPLPPTATHTAPPTNTSPPTATRTHTPIPTVTPTQGAFADDGCQMGSGSNSNALLVLLLPVAFMAALRRRSR